MKILKQKGFSNTTCEKNKPTNLFRVILRKLWEFYFVWLSLSEFVQKRFREQVISGLHQHSAGIISRILLEWEDEGRVWHLVTCNLCTTFGVTIPVTILVTSRNPRNQQRWIRGRGQGSAGPCPSPMVSNVHINNLIWNNVRTTSRHQSFTSVAVC